MHPGLGAESDEDQVLDSRYSYMDIGKDRVVTYGVTSGPRGRAACAGATTRTGRAQGTEEAHRAVRGDALGQPRAMVPPLAADKSVEILYSCVHIASCHTVCDNSGSRPNLKIIIADGTIDNQIICVAGNSFDTTVS